MNLKKKVVSRKDIELDHFKDYEMLYHKAMKTAHLNTIYVYFIAPDFNSSAKEYIKELPDRVIKRPGCNPCTVKYRLFRYEWLAAYLLKQAPSTALRSFIINYGKNV